MGTVDEQGFAFRAEFEFFPRFPDVDVAEDRLAPGVVAVGDVPQVLDHGQLPGLGHLERRRVVGEGRGRRRPVIAAEVQVPHAPRADGVDVGPVNVRAVE